MGYDMQSQVGTLPTVDEITRQMESLLYPNMETLPETLQIATE